MYRGKVAKIIAWNNSSNYVSGENIGAYLVAFFNILKLYEFPSHDPQFKVGPDVTANLAFNSIFKSSMYMI
jgi:hypothetical protein